MGGGAMLPGYGLLSRRVVPLPTAVGMQRVFERGKDSNPAIQFGQVESFSFSQTIVLRSCTYLRKLAACLQSDRHCH